MVEQHLFFSANAIGKFFDFGEVGYDFPESVLGMGIVKILLPRGGGWEGSQNEYRGFPVKNWCQWMR
jgi:hypothetical protein